MQAGHVPGAQIAILRDGSVVVSQAYGVANVARSTPVTQDSQFEIGSITKQFTAAAILQLKEQGKLRLSDPLGKYVPEYPRGKKITIEQLLRQVSGIPDYLNDTKASESVVSKTPGGLDAALKLIVKMPLHFAPGTRWRYSNTNYLLLGAIVARVSGVPYEQYIREHIFKPAGMSNSAFVRDEPSLPAMATGYEIGKGPPRVAPAIQDGWAGGAGAIVSTALDLAKWDAAFFGGKIVSPQDVTLATTSATLPDGESTRYGFGWGIDTLDSQPMIWHNGGSLGFVSQNDYFPVQREAIVVLTNDNGPSAAAIAERVFETLNPEIAAASAKPAEGEDPAVTALAKKWLQLSQQGKLDKADLTQEFAEFLTPERTGQAKDGLAPLGEPQSFVYRGKQTMNGVTIYTYRVTFDSAALMMTIGIDGKGKIAGLGFRPA